MKRPLKSDEPTADLILDAASKLFYARGLHSVSLDEIAASAQLTKRTLYYHFPTKDDLVTAYVRRRKARARLRDDATTNDPVAQLLSAFDQMAIEASKPGFRGCPFVNALAEINDAHHAASKLVVEHKQDRHRWFEALLKRAKVPQPAKRARQIMVLWEGAMVRARVTASATPFRDAKEAVALLIGAHV